MAAPNPLENEISCSVCLDVYEDPHVLKQCLHTYCLKCIQRIEKRAQVQCPDCRTFNAITDIKKDFKTQRLIDIHNESQTDPVQPIITGPDQCGMCQNKTVPITHRCSDCEIFLCSGCAEGHKTNKLLASHKVISTASLMKKIGSELKTTLGEIDKQVQNIDGKLETVSQSLDGADKANTQQIENIRKYTEEGIEELQGNQKRLEELVVGANQTLVDHLQKCKALFEEQRKELLSKRESMKDLIQDHEKGTLQGGSHTMSQNMKEDIEKIKEIIESKRVKLESPVDVQKSKNWDVKESVKVTVENVQYDCQETEPMLETLYTELYSKKFTLLETTKLSLTYSLFMVNNQLWCNGYDSVLNVYDKNCQLMKKIKVKELTNIESVAASNTGHIVLACRGKRGLHLIQSNGEYQSKIADGSFADVVSYNGDVYALEYQQCKIIIFGHNDNKWSETRRYTLRCNKGSDYDRLRVQKTGIYVSSWTNNCIYMYDIDGKFLDSKGWEGSHRPGLLDGPILCGVDRVGNILVADSNNNALQVYDRKGEWRVIDIPGEVYSPTGVLISDDGEMWILSQCPNKLQKYFMS